MMNDFINKMGEYWSQLSFDKLGDILTYQHNAPILFSSGLFFFLFIGFLIIYMSLRKPIKRKKNNPLLKSIGALCW